VITVRVVPGPRETLPLPKEVSLAGVPRAGDAVRLYTEGGGPCVREVGSVVWDGATGAPEVWMEAPSGRARPWPT
jgi:hypothetical protein